MIAQGVGADDDPLADLFPMKFLVTGGAGFIGSHLVTALRDRAADVVVLDNFSTGLEVNLPEAVTVVKGHAGDSAILEGILPGCAAVFHLAAVSSVQASMDNPLEVHNLNLTTTLALLEAARKHKVKRFVFSSSAAVYGDTHGERALETMKPEPLSHYAVQKLAGEHYCQVYARLYGLEAVSLRYFNVFGSRQCSDSPYSGVIARFIDAARQARAPTIFGDGSQTRDFCPVADVVSANLAAATKPAGHVAGGIFNIGSGHSVSIRAVVDTVRGIFPAMPAPKEAPAREGEIAHSRADISHAREKLDYRPSVRFTEALQKLASDCS
jgi:nucleoside-diphosphate-sugar epimerase